MVAYGDDDEFLKEYIQSLPTATCFVELVEVFRRPGERSDISQTKFTQLEPLAEHLTKKVVFLKNPLSTRVSWPESCLCLY